MVLILFGKDGCKNCKVVRDVLIVQGTEFEYINVQNVFKAEKLCEERGISIELDHVRVFPFAVKDNTAYSYEEIVSTIVEPILFPRDDRYTLFPIRYNDMYELLKKSRASFWNPEEIDFSKDYEDWESLDDNTRTFIKHVLAFFASADGIVLENLMSRFSSDVKMPEALHCYAIQEAMEAIHSETYSLLIQTYVKDPVERNTLFNGVKSIQSIRQKSEWVQHWLTGKQSFAERIVAFACVEGIMFSGSFCAIFWLKHQGKMPGLAFANELISRDEGLHTETAVALFHHLNNKPSQETIHQIVKGAVDQEKIFIIESLKTRMIGMNDELMSRYIEFVADRLLSQLGYQKIYNSENPFDWMENISLNGKTNFFEKRVGEYAKAGVMGSIERVFEMDTDF
jgi:ribonucleotide reductase beta subunit family protein with ferritin-like domain